MLFLNQTQIVIIWPILTTNFNTFFFFTATVSEGKDGGLELEHVQTIQVVQLIINDFYQPLAQQKKHYRLLSNLATGTAVHGTNIFLSWL